MTWTKAKQQRRNFGSKKGQLKVICLYRLKVTKKWFDNTEKKGKTKEKKVTIYRKRKTDKKVICNYLKQKQNKKWFVII